MLSCWTVYNRLQMRRRLVTAALAASVAWCQALEQAKRAFDDGRDAEAARPFEKAHQDSPRCDILFFLGMARYRLQQPDAALIAFQSAVQCDPKLLPAHLAMGEAYAERGTRTGACATFQKAWRLNPKNTAAMRSATPFSLETETQSFLNAR